MLASTLARWRRSPSKLASKQLFKPALFLPGSPSPLLRLEHPAAAAAGVNWYVKRDDCYALAPNDPYQGNKVRKLQGLLAQLETDALPLLTFGGAFSNHLGALASVGQRLGIATIGLVRGEEAVSNPLLDFCRSAGMQLHFVSRSDYRQKEAPDQLARWQAELGPAIIIPEGGSGPWASIGTAVIAQEIRTQLGYLPDFFQLAAGTAGTAAGLLQAFEQWGKAPNTAPREKPCSRIFANNKAAVALVNQPLPKVEIVSALKGNWMVEALKKQLPPSPLDIPWEVLATYHFGGYAKRPTDLLDFCRQFTAQSQLPLEPIYTAKLFYAVLDRIKKGCYPAGSTLVTYHSGGIYQLPAMEPDIKKLFSQ